MLPQRIRGRTACRMCAWVGIALGAGCCALSLACGGRGRGQASLALIADREDPTVYFQRSGDASTLKYSAPIELSATSDPFHFEGLKAACAVACAHRKLGVFGSGMAQGTVEFASGHNPHVAVVCLVVQDASARTRPSHWSKFAAPARACDITEMSG